MTSQELVRLVCKVTDRAFAKEAARRAGARKQGKKKGAKR